MIHQCHLCAARFDDDNSFAEHCGRHRNGGRNDRGERDYTNQRQAERAMGDDLKEIRCHRMSASR